MLGRLASGHRKSTCFCPSLLFLHSTQQIMIISTLSTLCPPCHQDLPVTGTYTTVTMLCDVSQRDSVDTEWPCDPCLTGPGCNYCNMLLYWPDRYFVIVICQLKLRNFIFVLSVLIIFQILVELYCYELSSE